MTQFCLCDLSLQSLICFHVNRVVPCALWVTVSQMTKAENTLQTNEVKPTLLWAGLWPKSEAKKEQGILF